MIEAECARASERRRDERLISAHHPIFHDLLAASAREHRREASFFQDVARVVARHGIAAQAGRDVASDESRIRRAAMTELGVRLRTVGDRCARLPDRFDVRLVYPDAMGEQWPRA